MKATTIGRRAPPAAAQALPVVVPAGAGGRSVALGGAQCLRIADGAGSVITCDAGELWVTRDGSWHDIVLAPGQAVRIADAAPVLVSGFGPSLARVSAPVGRAPWWRRALPWWSIAHGLARTFQQVVGIGS